MDFFFILNFYIFLDRRLLIITQITYFKLIIILFIWMHFLQSSLYGS